MMEDRFDAVSVWIAHERRVGPGPILRAGSGSAVVGGPVPQSDRVERIHLLPIGGAECDVTALAGWPCLFAGSKDGKGFVMGARPAPPKGAFVRKHTRVSERRKTRIVERACLSKIPDANRYVVE
jgi:hypothetical protein